MRTTQPTPTTNRFFIYDCEGNIAGNPSGYRTMRGALQQAESRHGKAYRHLWRTFYASQEKKDNPNRELIYEIITND
jgi:hypothetical protein